MMLRQKYCPILKAFHQHRPRHIEELKDLKKESKCDIAVHEAEMKDLTENIAVNNESQHALGR